MENVNNEILTEETMDIMVDGDFNPELIEEIRKNSASKLALGTIVVGGVIAAGYGLKKLWDKKKSKKTSSEKIVTAEDFEDVEYEDAE